MGSPGAPFGYKMGSTKGLKEDLSDCDKRHLFVLLWNASNDIHQSRLHW